MKQFLLDTDVLINWIRGLKWEKELIMSSGIDFYYSRVTRKELFQYKKIRSKEKKKILYLLNCFKEIPITSSIAQKASLLLQKYKQDPLSPADALIAATAWDKNLTLVTKNKKHFAFISEIRLN